MTNVVDVLRDEYDALKKEQIERIKVRDNLTYLTIGAVAAAVYGAIQAHTPLLLLTLPFVCTALGWKYVANDHKITAIGAYLRGELADRMSGLVGEAVLGWETAHRVDHNRRRRMWLQYGADLLTFVAPGIAGITAVLVAGVPHPAAGWAGLAGLLLSLLLCWQITAHADLAKGH